MASETPNQKRPYSFGVVVRGYPVRVLVAVGLKREAMIRKLTATGCSEKGCLAEWAYKDDPFEWGRSSMFPCHNAVLWLRNDRLDLDSRALIAHEVFHIIFGVLPPLGIRLTDDTEEAFAYAIGNLTKDVLEGIGRRKGSRK